jgi:Cys-tRNA(Pro)/Cys-tRNA(Cys) deacylase
MSTRAIKFLEQRGIPFEVVKYEHKEKGAGFAAGATGFPLERTIKTLVVDLGDKRYCIALLAGDKKLSEKRLAKACSVKRAAMADAATAERLTGYLLGGISPFGSKQKLPVVMEKSILNFDQVLVNAGQRGTLLKMSPAAIKKALDCTVASVGD